MVEDDDDLASFFDGDEFADAATWGVHTAEVIIDAPTEDALGGRAATNEYAITLPSSKFVGIKREDTVVITTGRLAGTYKLRENPRPSDIGAMKILMVTKLS